MPLLRPFLACAMLAGVLSACASHPSYRTAYRTGRAHPSGRVYVAPGPPEDPWGPHIREASARFRIPEVWVRAVMRQESGGQQYQAGGLTTSWAGAMGLMQVMPDTYEGLRQRYRLGDDPYEPHDNILAGAAYIREMYDRYGAPGFLAAYNAGPNRLDDYLAGGSALPNETVNYLASVAPRLGGGVALSGPLSVYADAGDGSGYAAPLESSRPATTAAPIPSVIAMEPIASPGDFPEPADAAAPAPAPFPPAPGFRLVTTATPPRPSSSEPLSGSWGVQVGAFDSPAQARAAAEIARGLVPTLPRTAQTRVGSTTRPGGTVLFRARLVGLSGIAADDACRAIRAYRRDCMVVPPDSSS